jgi:hypothetical protein
MRENVRNGLRRGAELSDDEVEQIKLGSWRLDCPRMLLRSRGDSPKQTYSGPGYVFQPAPGVLSFHLYSYRGQSALRSEGQDLAQAGETLPEDAYFDLEVTDVTGRRWTSKRLIPASIDPTAMGKVIGDGQLTTLSTKAVLPRTLKVKGHSVDIRAFQRLELPWNAGTVRRSSTARGRRRSKAFSRDAWAFRCQGLDVLIVQGADRMSMEVYSESNRLPPKIERRLLEALEFVVGHAVHCQTVCIRRSHTVETTVFAMRGDLGTARWQPPLVQQWVSGPGTNRITSRHHRRLFERFLLHGISCGARVHSVSGQLAAIREASTARYIDAYALTMTVAVESLAFSDMHVRVRRPTERQIDSLLGWIRDWRGSEDLKKRAHGAVANLGKTRAGDILLNLVRKSVITKQQYDAWQKLRNRSAHEYQLRRGNPNQLRELLPIVQVLFYRMVFHAIGYRGPYTDYSSPGWPIRQHPGTSEGPPNNRLKPSAT